MTPGIEIGAAVRRSGASVRGKSARLYRRGTAHQRMLPTFVIIGAMKGGTSSLHEYLVAHPDVGRPISKEIHYFTHNYDRGPRWYKSRFPRLGEYPHTLDSTPYYLFHPLAPQRAHETVPDAKLIVLLRDPVARAHSHHNHAYSLGWDDLDFRTALAREDARLAGEEERIVADPRYRSVSHQHHSYIHRSLYVPQLQRWYRYFDRERVLVIPSEDLFGDVEGTLHRVQSWLGLSHHTPASLKAENARSYVGLDPELRAQLTERFAPEMTPLPELTGIEAPWIARS